MLPSVVVLGAGPAGAGAALFLARRGHDVTILDSDSLGSGPLELRNRRGVPHARQGHSFLALGIDVLRQETPEILDSMVSMGALRVALQHDHEHSNLLTRRSLFDAAMRHALSVEPRVHLLPGLCATGLLIKEAAATAPPQVFGLKTVKGDVRADIVIDAGGGQSPVPRWLAENQVKIIVVRDPTRFFYITRHYRLRAGASFPNVRIPIVAALDYASVLAFPEDNDYYQLTVQIDISDRSGRALRNSAVFERFLAEVPLIAPWLTAGAPVSEPQSIASAGNCRKQTFLGEPLVTGILMLGDAAVQTNPSAGRGVALALAHAQALANLISNCGNGWDPVKITEKWEYATSELHNPWLRNQIQIDCERSKQVRASIEGRPWRASNDVSARLAYGLDKLRDCSLVGAACDRLFNLLSTPEEIYCDRELMRRILRESRFGTLETSRVGPSRQEYQHLMGG